MPRRSGPTRGGARAAVLFALAVVPALVGTPRATEPEPAAGAAGSPAGPRVGYVHVEGVIDRLQARYLARALDDARSARLDTLIVHLDTDGGEVHYAREMFKALLDSGGGSVESRKDGPRLVAFVDFRALSAGAMIAYAHHEVHLTEGASIGDIGVIFRGPDGTIEYAPEKIETVIRTLLSQAAEQRGWPRGPLLKMTARNQNLYRITPPGGEAVYVIEDDLPAWLADHPEIDREDPAQVLVFRGHDRLLTLTGREAVSLGMATALADGLPALHARIGIDPDEVMDLRPGAAERAAVWLAGIAPLLMGLALLLLFFELNTPGVGVWAVLAAVFASLFLFAHYSLDLVEHFEIALLVLGLGMIAVELLLLPAGGALATAGGLCVLAGTVLSFLPNEIDLAPSDPDFRQAFFGAALNGATALAVAAGGLVLIFKIMPRARQFRSRMTVEAEITGTSGGGEDRSLIGRIGRAEGALRPAGTIVVGGVHHSARAAHGVWIGAGETVEIIGTELGETVVRPRPAGSGRH